MKSILLLLVLFIPFENLYSSYYIIKDTNGNKKIEIKGNVIRDNNWNKIGEIKNDGTIVDKNWNKVLKIERYK